MKQPKDDLRKNNAGGIRPGAGRKQGDKKTVQLWITESEEIELRKKLSEIRLNKLN